jgi:hypothetical protein
MKIARIKKDWAARQHGRAFTAASPGLPVFQFSIFNLQFAKSSLPTAKD